MSASHEGPDHTGELELELEVVERTGPNGPLGERRGGVLEQSGSVILDGLDDEEEDEDDSVTAAIDPLELPDDLDGPPLPGPFGEAAFADSAFEEDEPTALADPLPTPKPRVDALLEPRPTPPASRGLLLPTPAPGLQSPPEEEAEKTRDSTARAASKLTGSTGIEQPSSGSAPTSKPEPSIEADSLVPNAPAVSAPVIRTGDLNSQTAALDPLDLPEPEPDPSEDVSQPVPLDALTGESTEVPRKSPLSSLLSDEDDEEEEPTMAQLREPAPAPVLPPADDFVPKLPAAFAQDPSLFGDSMPPDAGELPTPALPLKSASAPVAGPAALSSTTPAPSSALVSPAPKSAQVLAPPPLPDDPKPRVSRVAPTQPPMPALKAPQSAPAALKAPATADEMGPRVVYADGEDHSDSMDGEVTSIYETQPPPSLPRGRLTLIGGEESGKVYYLNRPQIRMGRGNENDVVLLDIAVSRHHARIERHDAGFRLSDLDSGNGTMVNGARIQRAELYDGDRIEVGNILMEFATQGEARRRPTAEKHPPAPTTPHEQTDPGRQIVGLAKGKRRPPPPVWLVFLGTFVVITALTLLVQRSLMSDREAPEDPARIKARSYYDRAEAAMRSRQWTEALNNLATAAELAPEIYREGEQKKAHTTLIAEIEKEQGHKTVLEEATALVERATPEALKSLLGGIPQDSVYYPDAMRLVDRAQRLTLDARTKEAERLAHAGLVAQALVITEEVLTRAPTHEGARALGDMLKAAVREGAPPAELAKSMGRATPADQRARRDLADALRLYRDMRFAGALAALERGVARKPSRALKARLLKRVDKLKAFTMAWEAAERAMKGRRAEEAITHLSQGSAIDQELGGFFAQRIHEKLALLHYIRAKEAYDRGQWQVARRHNDRVLTFSAADDNGRKLRALLVKKAQDLLYRAQNISLKSPREAHTLVRQVLNIAPQSSDTYQKAYRLLQQVKP